MHKYVIKKKLGEILYTVFISVLVTAIFDFLLPATVFLKNSTSVIQFRPYPVELLIDSTYNVTLFEIMLQNYGAYLEKDGAGIKGKIKLTGFKNGDIDLSKSLWTYQVCI